MFSGVKDHSRMYSGLRVLLYYTGAVMRYWIGTKLWDPSYQEQHVL